MRLERLRLKNLRNICELDVTLGPRINFFVGPNGAGKTSILEGAYLLSHGRSFRAGQYDVLMRQGTEQMTLFAELERRSGRIRLGLLREDDQWRGRINETTAVTLADVLQELAVVCFEPGSHALISGPSQERRRFLDWGVFHVEHDYWPNARRYRRALQQRNRLLKQTVNARELDVWDHELAVTANILDQYRQNYFSQFASELCVLLQTLLPELGEAGAEFFRGWPENQDLQACLLQARQRDQARGHTTAGPHRADWRIRFEHAPQREQLSRGQEKLCALACVLAQAHHYASVCDEWPVIAFDDLSSELDEAHQQQVSELLVSSGTQVLVTGTTIPQGLSASEAKMQVFHVEHGEVRPLL